MRIDVNKAILTFENDPIPIQGSKDGFLTVGKAIANILAGPKTPKLSPFKSYELALKFYRLAQIDLDEADFQAVKSIVEATTTYPNLVLGQVMKALAGEGVKGENK